MHDSVRGVSKVHVDDREEVIKKPSMLQKFIHLISIQRGIKVTFPNRELN